MSDADWFKGHMDHSRRDLARDRAENRERTARAMIAARQYGSLLCPECMRPKMEQERYWVTSERIYPDPGCPTCHGEGLHDGV